MSTEATTERRVSSRDGAANDLIEELRAMTRKLALGIAKLGDSIAESRAHEESMQRSLADQEDANDTLASWRELLEDFGRELVDKNELLARTVRA